MQETRHPDAHKKHSPIRAHLQSPAREKQGDSEVFHFLHPLDAKMFRAKKKGNIALLDSSTDPGKFLSLLGSIYTYSHPTLKNLRFFGGFRLSSGSFSSGSSSSFFFSFQICTKQQLFEVGGSAWLGLAFLGYGFFVGWGTVGCGLWAFWAMAFWGP